MYKSIDIEYAANNLPKRSENSNKSTFGRILNIAGSKNYPGAAYLSSVSALKTGAGYLTLASIDEVIKSVCSLTPVVTYIELNSINGVICSDNKIENIESYDVLSLGCGLTCNSETSEFVIDILKNKPPLKPMVLDADGINILSKYKQDIKLQNTIITPHPKELSRLLDVETEVIQANRDKYAMLASQKYNCITVLKGHNSIITDGNEVYINKTGSSALAKAGTGDVLTGIICGLLAQKTDILNAALLGAFIHGLSGDLAAVKLSEYCVLPTDVIDYIPFAINEILKKSR